MRAFILAICLAMAAGCAKSPHVCAVCQREECTGMAFRMTLENGKVVETCCPRCAMHYLENNHQKAVKMEATDMATGRWIDATTAVYLSDSDMHPCAEMQSMRDPQGCCLMKTYDRCLPSLVAFADKDQAATFQKTHGGQIVAFASIPAR
ncbi:MAG TPA: nitrous oxide reductase accessory protein NosL [Verrucomicrobiae bacterium]|nr:nitrous oxide reductase accessory protein NosL [Verrucomicrobiae bacterium]